MMAIARAAILLAVCLLLPACQYSVRQVLESPPSQVELRSFQTRAFDTTDSEKTLRAVMATLQDLGFVIFHADRTLGLVSGAKRDSAETRMTVTVRLRGATHLLVRANARSNAASVVEPEPYQQFFTALSRAMFLEAHGVD